MTILVTILATLGFLALLRHWARASFRVARGGVELYLGRESAQVRAQRGDLTGLAEAQELNRRARRFRARALLELAAYSVLLATPLFSVWGKTVYVLCSALWLLEAIPARPKVQ